MPYVKLVSSSIIVVLSSSGSRVSSLRRELADPLAMRAADRIVALGLGVVQRRISPAGMEDVELTSAALEERASGPPTPGTAR